MAKKNPEEFSTERLKRSIKIGYALLLMLMIVIVLSLAIIVYDLIKGNGLQTYLFVSAGGCFLLALIVYSGNKKTKEYLTRRSDN